MPELVIEQRRRDLGGFEVGRVLPFVQRRMVGPFVFFDHMGPVQLNVGLPRSVDVRPHPHIGLSTVTYLFEGEVMHRDSVGSEQSIHPGAVNWMTAGRGITHSERFERARRQGDLVHGIQSWVALPERDEETEPAFFHYGAAELPVFDDGAVWARLIAGEASGVTAVVRTHSPMFYLHWELKPGARVSMPGGHAERAAYVVKGSVEIDGTSLVPGQMAVLAAKEPGVLRAVTAATVMALGGEPLGHRYIEWNFVSSSKDRIEQAKADWRAGRIKLPEFDHEEFIPLPEDPATRGKPAT